MCLENKDNIHTIYNIYISYMYMELQSRNDNNDNNKIRIVLKHKYSILKQYNSQGKKIMIMTII